MTNKFYFAPPRQGNTFVVVAEAIDYLKKGKKVFSNFPIITPDGLQSQVWKPEFIYKNIQNALVIIDEAQADFDSQTHKALNEDEDAFFATSGHNGIEVRIISQNLTRVTKAVRDRVNEFIFVQSGKIFVPFLRDREGRWGRPLYFTTTSYLTLEDLESHIEERIYLRSRIFFKGYTAASYDTHYFKRQGEIFNPPYWYDYLKSIKANTEEVDKYIQGINPNKFSYKIKLMIQRFKNRKSFIEFLKEEW
jgi:hypothetical protein